MSNPYYYTPGEISTIVLVVNGSDGYLADCPKIPVVNSVQLPDLTFDIAYPQDMTKANTGTYIFQYQIPPMAMAVGSYLVDITYQDPITLTYKEIVYQIIVNAPYGVYNAVTQ